mgnify:CR=1 FL=1
MRPNFLYIPVAKARLAPTIQARPRGRDADAFAIWVDVTRIKNLRVTPYWFSLFRNKFQGNPAFPGVPVVPPLRDVEMHWFGFTSEYRAKRWFANLLFSWLTGDIEFRSEAIPGGPDLAAPALQGRTKDISAFAAEAAFGVTLSPFRVSVGGIFRTGDDQRRRLLTNARDSHQFRSLVTFFGNVNEVSQLVTTAFQHPAQELEVFAGPGDPATGGLVFGTQNDAFAGVGVAWLKGEWNITKRTRLVGMYSHLRTHRSIDTNGDGRGDNSDVGEAIDAWVNHTIVPRLTVNFGGTYLFAGSALDAPDPVVPGASRRANDIWSLWASVIWAF